MRRKYLFLVFGMLCSFSYAARAEQAKESKTVLSTFQMRIYGYLKLDMAYDDSRTYVGNIAFWADPEAAGNDNQFNLTVNQSRLGLGIEGPAYGSAKSSGVLEMDFYGGGGENVPHPRLFRGYIDLVWPTVQVRIGQDWDVHSSLYPTVLNFGYVSTAGNIMYRRPQVRVVKTFPVTEKSAFSLAGAVARTIGQDLDKDGVNDGDDSGFPTWEGRVAYENKSFAGAPLMLSFSGHYGREDVDWDGPAHPYKIDSWSINGELIVPVCKYVSATGEAFYGSNLDAYFGGILQGVNSKTRRGIHARGGWGEVTVKPSAKLSLHFGGGVDQPRSEDLNDGDREQNSVLYGNVYRKWDPNLTLALEVSHYGTRYKNAAPAADNRVQAACMFGF